MLSPANQPRHQSIDLQALWENAKQQAANRSAADSREAAGGASLTLTLTITLTRSRSR